MPCFDEPGGPIVTPGGGASLVSPDIVRGSWTPTQVPRLPLAVINSYYYYRFFLDAALLECRTEGVMRIGQTLWASFQAVPARDEHRDISVHLASPAGRPRGCLAVRGRVCSLSRI